MRRTLVAIRELLLKQPSLIHRNCQTLGGGEAPLPNVQFPYVLLTCLPFDVGDIEVANLCAHFVHKRPEAEPQKRAHCAGKDLGCAGGPKIEQSVESNYQTVDETVALVAVRVTLLIAPSGVPPGHRHLA